MGRHVNSAVFQTDLVKRYLEARRKIDPEIRLIHSLSGLLAKFEQFERDRLEVDPVALGVVNGALEQSTLNIRAALDDFLTVNAAHRKLEEERQSDGDNSCRLKSMEGIGVDTAACGRSHDRFLPGRQSKNR